MSQLFLYSFYILLFTHLRSWSMCDTGDQVSSLFWHAKRKPSITVFRLHSLCPKQMLSCCRAGQQKNSTLTSRVCNDRAAWGASAELVSSVPADHHVFLIACFQLQIRRSKENTRIQMQYLIFLACIGSLEIENRPLSQTLSSHKDHSQLTVKHQTCTFFFWFVVLDI